MEVLGSFGAPNLHIQTSCGALLTQLQHIWSEIGENEAEKNRVLMEIDRECLQVYQKKVDEANNAKINLHQSLAALDAEVATLVAALGELNLQNQLYTLKRSTPLKEQLASVTPLVEDLRRKKEQRIKEFMDIRSQIEKISGEISGCSHFSDAMTGSENMDEHDISLRKLNEYKTHLSTLQKEKSDRLHKILECVNEVHSLCGILDLDFGKTVEEVHPSLHASSTKQSTNISSNTLEGLNVAILKLKMERTDRFQKLKDILVSLVKLWDLMDSSVAEMSHFGKLSFILRSSELEIIEHGVLSLEIIEQAAAEVERLNKLKSARMKELVMKKRSELEDLCRKAHIEPDMSTTREKSVALIDSGIVDPSELLASIEAQIMSVKDETIIRKEIMDRIDRWLAACEEERWLEDYDQDDKRYSAGRGAHINLKRAERARVTVNKIPAILENLMNRTLAWENQRKKDFLYDGVRLLSILDDYKLMRRSKEEEKKKYKNQKKLQDLLLTEKEARYGSKPSPKLSNSFRKGNGYHVNVNGSLPPTPRRLSVGSITSDILTPRSHFGRQNGYFKDVKRSSTGSLNFSSLSKEDTTSLASISGSELGSPPHG